MSLKTTAALALLLGLGAAPAFCQEEVFNWLPANDESVHMDPPNYHTGRTYRPGQHGGSIHIDIEAQRLCDDCADFRGGQESSFAESFSDRP
jgi:hypothetical protein